jgi:hypothetical protein
MLNKILKVMLIVILLPLFAMCSVAALDIGKDIGKGVKQGYDQAKEEAEVAIVYL